MALVGSYFVSEMQELKLALIVAALIAVGIVLTGCSQVQMSPAYQQELYMSNVLVQSLHADCQAGDPNACKEGLNESAQILQLLVDAVEGRATEVDI